MTDAFKYGGVSFPLPGTASDPAALLKAADPALYYTIDFVKAMIAEYVGARLIAEATACSCPIASAVALTLPFAPGPYLMQTAPKLPLLAIYRVRGINDYRTVSRSHEATTWTLDYVLPAMSPAQSQRIQPLLPSIEKLIQNRLEHAWDSAYTPPGGTLGQQFSALAGLERIDATECSYGAFEGMGNLYLPALSMTLVVKEKNTPSTGVAFQGADVAIGLNATDGSTIADFVDLDSNHNTPP